MMRVIAGLYKNRKISEVPSINTRPTTDRNKEKLFNILGQFFEGGRVLDLYAGSGALGIEALSRGMDSAVLVDHDAIAVKTIRLNLDHLSIQHATVVFEDALHYINRFNDQPFDLILMDPPYLFKAIEDLLKGIENHQMLTDEGVVVVETEKSTGLPTAVLSLTKIREATEGIAKFTFYRKEVTR